MNATAIRTALLALHIANSAGGGARLVRSVADVLLRAGYVEESAPGIFRLTQRGRVADPCKPPLPTLRPTDRLALEYVCESGACIGCHLPLGRELAASIEPEADNDNDDRELICLACARRLLLEQVDVPDYSLRPAAQPPRAPSAPSRAPDAAEEARTTPCSCPTERPPVDQVLS